MIEPASSNIRGITFILIAMIGFTLEDMFIKQLSGNVSSGQIMLTFGAAGTIIFGLIAFFTKENIFAPEAWTRYTLLRAIGEGIAIIGMVKSLTYVDLSTVAAVFQVTPLVIAMGAAIFYKEAVGWRRWSAIFVGFIGVLLIVRPGVEGFSPAVLLVFLAIFGVALRDLITRMIPTTISSTVVSLQAFCVGIITGVIVLLVEGDRMLPIAQTEIVYFAAGITFAVIGYYAIVAAMRGGDYSSIMPFRYTRLLFSLIAGVLWFKERPDMLTLIGAAIIIATGVYLINRERKMKQKL